MKNSFAWSFIWNTHRINGTNGIFTYMKAIRINYSCRQICPIDPMGYEKHHPWIGLQNARYNHNCYGKVQSFSQQLLVIFLLVFALLFFCLKLGDVLLQRDEDLGPPIFSGVFW